MKYIRRLLFILFPPPLNNYDFVMKFRDDHKKEYEKWMKETGRVQVPRPVYRLPPEFENKIPKK